MPVTVFLLSVAVLLVDQISKSLIQKALHGVSTLPVIPGVFHLTLLTNTGVAFGMFRGYSLPVAIGTSAIIVGLLWSTVRRARPTVGYLTIGMGFILGGAVGNLIDRIRVGGVIDFLDFRIWPVFNVADSCITIGAVLMSWELLRHR